MSISLAQARWHLRIDSEVTATPGVVTSPYDAEIQQKLYLAQVLATNYLNLDDEHGPETVTEAAATDAATLLILGDLWANRESSAANPLSPGVRLILDRFKNRGYA